MYLFCCWYQILISAIKQEVRDDLSVCVLNLEFVELKSCFIRNVFLQYFIVARILKRLGELPQILDHRLTLTEAAIEKFLENSYTFYDRQIILPRIVLLRSSWTRNVRFVNQRKIGKVRQAKQIRSIRVYDKC